MDSSSPARAFRPTRLQEFLHLCALSSFSIVQPVLDSLANNVAFLRYYDYSPAAVLLTITSLTLGLPVLLLVFRIVVDRIGVPKCADVIRTTLMVLLCLLAMLYTARWASATLWSYEYLLSEDLLFLPSLLISGWLARLYFRSGIFRQFLSVSAVGVLLFPAVFFLNPAVQEQVLQIPAREYFQPVAASSPVPIIFVVFDGLSGMALLNESHEIDRDRYPSFAGLGDRCNFYRNASTVHTRTDHALPAILSGSYPTGRQRPIENEYPLNLFRLLDNSRQFDQSIFEPYTQMAPTHLQRLKRRKSTLAQTFELLETVLRVYERMCLPRAMDSLAMDVPREWFRILPPTPADPKVLEGKIVYHWDTDHQRQVDHFVNCLNPSTRPALRFLHIGLPHDPWTRLPSGQLYRHTIMGKDLIYGGEEGIWIQDDWLVNQGWQRYLLQLQYADRCLGRILNHLEETNQFDEALIIVTADHGFAFRAGTSRRDPEATTLSDLIPVPLFVKYPKQQKGVVSDSNVETIDILPTIAETIGIPGDPQWEGVSLISRREQRLRKTVIAESTKMSDIVIEAGFPGRFDYVERLHKVFGKGPDNPEMNLQFIPELHMKEVSTFQIEKNSKSTIEIVEGLLPSDAEEQGLVPCYFVGRIHDPVTSEQPAIVAATVNGVIRATTRTSIDPGHSGLWTMMIPDSAFSGPEHHLQFFEVEHVADTFKFHELKLQ
jgi:hypothetical protein